VQSLAALAEYKKAHGHCRLPIGNKEHAGLGNWVMTQRAHFRKGKLSQEQIRRLDDLGFVWDASGEAWERRQRRGGRSGRPLARSQPDAK
jgi:hypothetical protein